MRHDRADLIGCEAAPRELRPAPRRHIPVGLIVFHRKLAAGSAPYD